MRAWYLCALAACGDTATPAKLPDWDKALPSASVMGTFGGLTPARGIIHLHSPFSHDACDGNPRANGTGAINEPCLQSLRAALCIDRIDYAALTDHDDTMADEEYASLFHMRAGDEPVMDGGAIVASRIRCENGHEVLVSVGGENDLMPIMLDQHVAGTALERHSIYNGKDAADVAAMRAAGAKIWIPHSEQRTHEHLLDVAPDGMEIYNLHANIDPDIRPMYLGLDSFGAISAAVEFADTNEGGPTPDLALLAFLAPNAPALALWDSQLAAGRKLAGSAGSDAHENALPIILADGERGDSYRRVMRWFGNIALVTDPRDPIEIEAALAAGRMFAVFELLGTPDGFAIDAGGQTMGSTVPAGTMLHVTPPKVRDLDPTLPAPAIRVTVIHVSPGGPSTLATSDTGPIDVALPAGAVRVEVSIVPRHLGPYLFDLGPAKAEQELPWIYTSPIYVQ